MIKSKIKVIERLKKALSSLKKESKLSNEEVKNKTNLLNSLISSCDHSNEEGYSTIIDWHPWFNIEEPFCSICGKKNIKEIKR